MLCEMFTNGMFVFDDEHFINKTKLLCYECVKHDENDNWMQMKHMFYMFIISH